MSKNKTTEKKRKEWRFPGLNLDKRTKRDIVVIFFVLTGIVALLAVFNLAGSFGTGLFTIFKIIFGILAYAAPLLFGLIAYELFKDRAHSDEFSTSYLRVYLGIILFVGSLAGLIHLLMSSGTESMFRFAMEGFGGGLIGALFAWPLATWLGYAGGVVLFALLFMGVLITFNIPLISQLKSFNNSAKPIKQETSEVKINTLTTAGFVSDSVTDKNKRPEVKPVEISRENPAVQPQLSTTADLKLEGVKMDDRTDWKTPSFDLLDENNSTVDSGNIEANMALIEKTLRDFGILVEMGEVNVGPTVTQYTLRPAIGIKLSQIAALQNDLALALAAQSIRMELPIPGKPFVGIEVPNKATALVRLRDVMQTTNFVNHKSRLALALGRDVTGTPQIVDLVKMPHLLIAGATGTGKSVAINSLLVSLLYRNTPQQVKFIVVDPKRVELSLYNGIPHLLTPVVTDHEKAVNALKWTVSEMDRRYRLLADAGKRNIGEYNEVNSLPLPYLVIIVDELADLMAVSQADVEAAIVRLSQMARAVGIHLILATQRPSVEVITGLIKANITSRIAFAVASQVDSRTILDSSGADKLLGNGDMLYVSAELSKPKRVQGAFIDEKEVKRVVDFFKKQTGAVIYNEEILEKPKIPLNIPGMSDSGEVDDSLYAAAEEEVKSAGKASASFLQRRLRVGYARAARLMDLLEQRGVIGPSDGAKPREVYGSIPKDEKAEYGIEDLAE